MREEHWCLVRCRLDISGSSSIRVQFCIVWWERMARLEKVSHQHWFLPHPTGLLYLWLRAAIWKNPSSGPIGLEIEYSSGSAQHRPHWPRAHTPPGTTSCDSREPRVSDGYFLSNHNVKTAFPIFHPRLLWALKWCFCRDMAFCSETNIWIAKWLGEVEARSKDQ